MARSSSREVTIRVPGFFSVVYFNRVPNPPPKKGQRALLGVLDDERWVWNLSGPHGERGTGIARGLVFDTPFTYLG